ncbi:MAG: aquaporin [Kiloniellales bacterium]
MPAFDLPRRLAAEALGTGLLVAAVIGSGIMGERLADGNLALALLGNTLATGTILTVLILIFGPVSGAHFNPVVTLAFALRREIAPGPALLYGGLQILGGLAGTALAHAMFAEPLYQFSLQQRGGNGQWLAELVATFGLLLTILGTLKVRPRAVPYTVGLFISAGYWFTASTSFANPAVTVARAFTDSFSGIAPAAVPAFLVAQCLGAALALALFAWLWAPAAETKPVIQRDAEATE